MTDYFARGLQHISSWINRFIPGFPPGDYYLFDIETTGLDPKTDLIVQVSWARVNDGIIGRESFNYALVSWEGIVDEDFLRERMALMEESMRSRGKEVQVTFDRVKNEGLLPQDSLCLFIRDIEADPRPVVAHNGYAFDLRFYLNALDRYCGISPSVPIQIIDTGMIYLAAELGIVHEFPSLDDFYRSVYLRRGATKWNLEYLCFDRFNLATRYTLRRDRLHDSFHDMMALHALYEHFRSLVNEVPVGH